MTLTLSEIEAEVKKMELESKAIRRNIYKMAWFMRGSVNVEQLFSMDIADQELIADIIKDNLETTKESGMPFY